MNHRILFAALTISVLSACTDATGQKDPVVLRNNIDSVSYGLGTDIGNNLRMQLQGELLDTLNTAALTEGIRDALDSTERMTADNVRELVQAFMLDAQKRMLAKARQILISELALAEKTDDEKASSLLDEVLAGGGEGLMLHRADAHWQPGRSEALRKLTPWLDAEARVVGYLPGKGRLQGRVGALQVETADGRRFRIGSGLSDALRANPPALGALVTYRYRELTPAGLPRFPRYLRERTLP